MNRLSLAWTVGSLRGVGSLSVFLFSLLGTLASAQAQTLPSRPVWEPAPFQPTARTFQWTQVEEFGVLPPQYAPIPLKLNPEELAAQPKVAGPYQSRGIYGVGAGMRAGFYTGDPTSGMITTRLGYKLDDNFSISLRPSGIYVPDNNNNNNNNNDNNNDNNSDFEFRLPLTFDLFYNSFISPYLGGGIATNVDGLGYTDGMLTGGVDINVTKWITVGLNINYVFQTNIDDTDWEALGMVYLRF